ncbi:MAG TPA: AAA family ATPase, partial [Pseudomonas sp.]|nr:AAA family ATPase [Pseudomonas sp.]
APARKKILIVGNPAEAGCEFLEAGLRKEGCAVFSYAGPNDLDNAALKGASLVFILISGMQQPTLYTQVDSLIRRGRAISVIPVVQYA